MKELSDKELDELFRKSSEEFEPDYEPGDWQELRRRLDAADGVTGAAWFRKAAPWLAGLLLLLLVGAGVYYYAGSGNGASERVPGETPALREGVDSGRSEAAAGVGEKNESTPNAPGASVPDGGTLDARPEASGPESTLRPSAGKAPERSVAGGKAVGSPEAVTDLKTKESPRNLVSASGVRKPTAPQRDGGDGAVLLSSESTPADPAAEAAASSQRSPEPTAAAESARNESTPPPVAVPGQPDASSSGGLLDQLPLGARKYPADNGSFRLELPPLDPLTPRVAGQRGSGPDFPTGPRTAVAYTAPVVSRPETPAEAEVLVPQWSVRLGISPDISVVDMSDVMNSMDPGPAAALLVEGAIAKRWSLQTGLIRSLKNYYAPGSAYEWTWGYKQPDAPSGVDGSCTVLEVPLNLRFDVIQRPRSRWFVGAGASSYKMQKEKYKYEYDKYVHNAMPGWRSKSPSSWNLFTHANASLGYERFLSKRLSLVAEPYVRIPLRGVGIGKVNLYSTGIWLSARYTPVFRR